MRHNMNVCIILLIVSQLFFFNNYSFNQNLISFKKDTNILKEGELNRLIKICNIINNNKTAYIINLCSNVDFSSNSSQNLLGFKRYLLVKNILDSILVPSDSFLITYIPEPRLLYKYDSGLIMIIDNYCHLENNLVIKMNGLLGKKLLNKKGNNILYITNTEPNNLLILNNIFNYINYSTPIKIIFYAEYSQGLPDSVDYNFYNAFLDIYTVLCVSNRENNKLNIGYSILDTKLSSISSVHNSNYLKFKIIEPCISGKIKILYKKKREKKYISIYENPFNMKINNNLKSNPE